MWLFDFDEDDFKAFAVVFGMLALFGIGFAVWGTVTGTFAREEREAKAKELQEVDRFQALFAAPAILLEDPGDPVHAQDQDAENLRGLKVKTLLLDDTSRVLASKQQLDKLKVSEVSADYSVQLQKIKEQKAQLASLVETLNEHASLACHFKINSGFSSFCYMRLSADSDSDVQSLVTLVNQKANAN